MDQSLCLLMKIKTVTGCSLEMSPGSKLLLNSISISLSVKKMVPLYELFVTTCRIFTESCRKLKIMKSSDSIGLGKSHFCFAKHLPLISEY